MSRRDDRDWRFSRRALLAQLGASAAFLPLLSTSRGWAAPAAPKRFLFVQWTNGVLTKHFWPNGGETDFTMGDCTAPLDPYKKDLLVLQGIDLASAKDDPFCGAGHQTLPHLLTGARSAPTDITGGDPGSRGIGNAISVDQHIAEAIAQRTPTPLKSLELGVQTGKQRPTHQYISFRGPAQNKSYPQGNMVEDDPYAAFKRLFEGKSLSPEVIDRLRKERKSVLDVVNKNLQKIQKNLGSDDKKTIDEHTAAVRALEMELEALNASGASAQSCGANPPAAGVDPKSRDKYQDVAKLQFDLSVLAFKCDITRVITVMFSNSADTSTTFAFLGGDFLKASDPKTGVGSGSIIGHHEIAHAAGDGDSPLKIQVDKWYMTQFAGLIKRFKEASDGAGGTLFDKSLLVMSNHMNNGAGHGISNVPIIMAGSAGGYYKTGRFLKLGGVAHNGLLASWASAMDVPTSSFGDAKYNTFTRIDPRLRG